MGYPYEVVAPEEVNDREQGLRLVIVDCKAILRAGPPRSPAIVICTNISVPGTAMADVIAGGGTLLASEELRPTPLFGSIFQVDRRRSPHHLETYLRRRLDGAEHGTDIVGLFLRHPANTIRIRDIRRALNVSERQAKRMIAQIGFHRAEHVATFLKAEVWTWYVGGGLKRYVVEHFLGIADRSNYRRACERAGIPPPWRR